MQDWIAVIGTAAAIVLPVFNIPLILRLRKRKTSNDFSLVWALGVWLCIVFMTPQALRSTDLTFRVFGALNLLFFSAVIFFILKYRSKT